MELCEKCGQVLPVCQVCEGPIPTPRIRRRAKTCSGKCGKQYRQAYLNEYRGMQVSSELMQAVRRAREFREILQVLQAEPEAVASGVE